MLVVVLVLENPDRFAIRLTEQISSSIGLFAVTESQCSEDEHEDEDEAIPNFGIWIEERTHRLPALEGRREIVGLFSCVIARKSWS